MKRLTFFLAVAAFAFGMMTFTACDKDEDTPKPTPTDTVPQNDTIPPAPVDTTATDPADTISLAGTWYMILSNDIDTIVMTDDMLYVERGDQKVEAKYHCTSNGEFTLSNVKVWNWNYGTESWAESESSAQHQIPETATVELLDNGAVLILRYDNPSIQLYNQWDLFYNADKTVTSDLSKAQGRWFWINEDADNAIRAAITIEGNNYDLVITAWGSRYTGTLTYENGALTLTVEGFSRTDREQMDDELYELIMTDPYSDRLPWVPEPYLDPLVIPFYVFDNQIAYSVVANLDAKFIKQ